MLQAEKSAGEVHAEHLLEVGQRHLGECAAGDDAGVVDEAVEPAMTPAHLVHARLPGDFVAHVEVHRRTARARFFSGPRSRRQVDVGGDDERPFGSERVNVRGPESATGPRDENDLPALCRGARVSSWAELDEHRRRPSGAQPDISPRLAFGQPQVRKGIEELVERDVHLGPGQHRTDAEVTTHAEGDMVRGATEGTVVHQVFASEAELVGALVLARVPIGGGARGTRSSRPG